MGERWYWDLQRQRAVRADERGPGDQTLGPYDSRAEAENWRQTVEERNEQWKADDEEWEGEPETPDDDD
jgi:hypothetical protein